MNDILGTKVCLKCDVEKELDAFARRGRGRHSWCSICLSAYQKAKRGPAKKKRKAWLNPRSWEGHPNGELMLKYEDAIGKTALLTMSAITKKEKGAWSAAFKAAKARDELRLQVMELLIR